MMDRFRPENFSPEPGSFMSSLWKAWEKVPPVSRTGVGMIGVSRASTGSRGGGAGPGTPEPGVPHKPLRGTHFLGDQWGGEHWDKRRVFPHQGITEKASLTDVRLGAHRGS